MSSRSPSPSYRLPSCRASSCPKPSSSKKNSIAVLSCPEMYGFSSSSARNFVHTPSPLFSYPIKESLSKQIIIIPPGFEDRKEEDSSKTCLMCLEHAKCCVILPCSHMCLCTTCILDVKEKIENKNFPCPVCRGEIESVRAVFM